MCRAPVGGMPNARAAATTCWRGSAAMRNRRAVTTPSDLDAFAHDHMFLGAAHDANARRTRWVVLLTAVMMVGEIDRKSTRLTPVTNAHLVCRLLLEKKTKKTMKTHNVEILVTPNTNIRETV